MINIYISATATKQYQQITYGFADEDGPNFCRAAERLEELIGIATYAKKTQGGYDEYRVRDKTDDHNRRLLLYVSTDQLAEGDAHQLIAVTDRDRRR